MKNLLSKGIIVKIALLMLLLLNAFAGMTILINAAPPIKPPTVFVYGSGSVELTRKSGKSETYSSNAYASFGGLDTIAFIPTHGWHINACLIDGNPVGILDEDGFSLIDARVKSSVNVTFVENAGVDDVDAGLGAEAYPDPGVGLIFVNVTATGYAYAYTIELQNASQIGEFWDVTTTAEFEPGITVILVLNLDDVLEVLDDPYDVRLCKTEYYLARSDVNWNEVVDGDDVSDVGNANPSELGDPKYDLRFDINNDNKVNDDDVNIVNNYVGEAVWEDITLRVDVDYDNELVYVYGVTDDLCILWSR